MFFLDTESGLWLKGTHMFLEDNDYTLYSESRFKETYLTL